MSGWSITAALVWGLCCLTPQVFAAPALPHAPSPRGSEAETAVQVPVEQFVAPRAKDLRAPSCGFSEVPGGGYLGIPREMKSACEALISGTGGWVKLGFMVDPKGKPFEITVISSTGNKTFEQVAIESIRHAKFEPGSLNGTPIESDYELRYLFYGSDSRVTHEFADGYKAVMHAIGAGDRAAADLAMKQLKISNLPEDAYFGLVTYSYATKWGDESQQLDGLERAVAGNYLPSDEFRAALLAYMKLELKTHEYSEAIDTSQRLEKSGIDKATAARIQAVANELEKLRSDGSEYEVQGQMPDGTWHLHLFKHHFRAVVAQGSISDVKLRCKKHYLYFRFDPTLNYEITGKDGDCSLELDGALGTRFTLVQF